MIAGTHRGRALAAPPGTSTRPTSDRVREALFNLLGDVPAGARVLDLFAGSGALGIEALSRGADSATFVEHARPALRALRDNLAALALESRARVRATDALSGDAFGGGPFDLVLADPPYGQGAGETVLERAAEVLAEGGVIALEHSERESVPEAPETLALWKSRRYGGTRVSLFHRLREESS